MSELSDAELMVLSSIQVYLARDTDRVAVGFGSGFLADYKGRRFFISVAHVTDEDGLDTYLETHLLDENKKNWIWQRVTGICYFNLLDASKINAPEELIDLIKNEPGERLDICFAEVSKEIKLYQPTVNFEAFQLPAAQKIVLDLDYTAAPDKNERFGFYGKVRSQYDGSVLNAQQTLKHSLSFHRTGGDFHIFLAPQIIRDKEDYQGCSGAPVLDSSQNLVGVACKVGVPSKMVFAFSIDKCKELIDYALKTGMLTESAA